MMRVDRVETFCSLVVSVSDVVIILRTIERTGSIGKEDPDIRRLKNELENAYKQMTGKEYGTK